MGKPLVRFCEGQEFNCEMHILFCRFMEVSCLLDSDEKEPKPGILAVDGVEKCHRLLHPDIQSSV